MTRCPAITHALAAHGFGAAARELGAARDSATEMFALRLALATIDGAAYMLRVHARALRHTGADFERGQLRALEEMIVQRLGELQRRARATAERAEVT